MIMEMLLIYLSPSPTTSFSLAIEKLEVLEKIT